MRNTPSMNHDNMHCDHILWESENALWIKNVEEWDKEINQARDTLKEIQERLSSYIVMYENHRQELLKQQSMLEAQEQKLKQTDTEEDDIRLIAYHQVEGEKHEKYKKAHEQMKTCHRHIISLMQGLKLTMDNNCIDY